MSKFAPFLVLAAFVAFWAWAPGGLAAKDMKREAVVQPAGTEVATFAGGCFWCIEADFEKVDGVVAAVSGFSGGTETDPRYDDVARGKTSHIETVQIFYDPKKTSYAKLLDKFFKTIDPTDGTGSFYDRGPHYRPVVFAHSDAQAELARAAIAKIDSLKIFDKKVAVEVKSFERFYSAENYHQDFYKKSPGHYQRYRRGSGRDDFIKKHWTGVPPLVSEKAGS
ncbi:MAG: peptide-methionine (S)-S-oxide reductase MsrA [Myxococcota bacterium]